mmetsp:Transcript_39258/g.101570  ORF Transcript_39258/g.101570 Transcript_39258/m.101570 type:complete len:292 (-) Transcript_39258:1171-2046(-)
MTKNASAITKEVIGDRITYTIMIMNMSTTLERSSSCESSGPGSVSGRRPNQTELRSFSVSVGPNWRRMNAVATGTTRSSSMHEPRNVLVITKTMKVVAWPGRPEPNMSWMVLNGSMMSSSSVAKRLPEIAEMKKICTIMNSVSLEKSDACASASDTCPSSDTNSPRIVGCSVTSSDSSRGCSSARAPEIQDAFSIMPLRNGRARCKFSTLLRDEMNATGIVQKMQMSTVSTMDKSSPHCFLLGARPTLFQSMQPGWHVGREKSLEGRSICSICSTDCVAYSELKETKPADR